MRATTALKARRWGVWVMAAAMVAGGNGSALAFRPGPADRCAAQKNEAAGAMANCLAKEYANQVLGKVPDFAKCEAAFTSAFFRAEQQAGAGVCPTEGDTIAFEFQIEAAVVSIAAALSGETPSATHEFPATGQTTCWNSAGAVISCAGTGHDGNIRAGAGLAYTDNGDGTITDIINGLMWGKQRFDGSIHDISNSYTWEGALTLHIGGLNAMAFAGYTDWRLPNVRELQSIVNYGEVDPAVSPAFNNSCVLPVCTVLTCSCTATSTGAYWSSSSYAPDPIAAWTVGFTAGSVAPVIKTVPFRHARAVRGGL